MADETKDKKRILYVAREYREGSNDDTKTRMIFKNLSKNYDVNLENNLSPWVLDLVDREKEKGNAYSGVISHVPFKQPSGSTPSFIFPIAFYAALYGDSLDVLAKLRERHEIPILAYSGVDNSPAAKCIFWNSGGIDGIVPKSGSWQKDLEEIENNLERLLSEDYLKITFGEIELEPFGLRREPGISVVNATINLRGGLSPVACMLFSEECNKHGREINIAKTCCGKREIFNGKSIMGLMGIGALRGEKLEILVEGEDEEASKIARSVYEFVNLREAPRQTGIK